jgi:hypothetical protein
MDKDADHSELVEDENSDEQPKHRTSLMFTPQTAS